MSAVACATPDIDLSGSVAWPDRNRVDVGRSKRYAAITFVLLIHFAVFWAMATAIRSRMPALARVGRATELEVRLISPNLVSRGTPAPPMDWDFLAPEDVPVAEPQIDIVPEHQAAGVGLADTRQKLPPRFDPTHINEKPELPRSVAMIGALSLELQILVLSDGTVGDAKVVKSSGQPEIDRIAIETVKGSWRYIPATVGGEPVDAWTTIVVRFAAL